MQESREGLRALNVVRDILDTLRLAVHEAGVHGDSRSFEFLKGSRTAIGWVLSERAASNDFQKFYQSLLQRPGVQEFTHYRGMKEQPLIYLDTDHRRTVRKVLLEKVEALRAAAKLPSGVQDDLLQQAIELLSVAARFKDEGRISCV